MYEYALAGPSRHPNLRSGNLLCWILSLGRQAQSHCLVFESFLSCEYESFLLFYLKQSTKHLAKKKQITKYKTCRLVNTFLLQTIYTFCSFIIFFFLLNRLQFYHSSNELIEFKFVQRFLDYLAIGNVDKQKANRMVNIDRTHSFCEVYMDELRSS